MKEEHRAPRASPPAGSKSPSDEATLPAAPPVTPSVGGGAPANAADLALDFLAPSEHEGDLGRLGPYRILKVLGLGGMGIVFKAEDPSLSRTVALKVMLPSVAQKASAKERFLREARTAAAIDHDNVVHIYQVGEDRGIPFLAMQFLTGLSLEDWLKKGKRPSLKQILKLGREIAQGLAAAHARGLVHRDIKPANIWLDASKGGRVKILDFGLARPANDETAITQEGMILGTPSYMSPEQARNVDVSARSDLFSLGCLLYRLATNELPFAGKDMMAILMALANDEPRPVRALNPDLPLALADLIRRLLAKKPADRPGSAQEVALALEEIERCLTLDQRVASLDAILVTPVPERTDDPTQIDDDLPPPRRKRQKVSPVAQSLLVVGGILVVLAIVCGGLTLLISLVFMRTAQEFQVVVKEFGKQGQLFAGHMKALDGNHPVIKNAPVQRIELGPDGQVVHNGTLTQVDPLVENKPFKVFEVQMEEQKNYQIDLVSGQFDAFLRLYNPKHQFIDQDDDGGGNLNSRLHFFAPETGLYRIHATCLFAQPVQGEFTLTVRHQQNPRPPEPPKAPKK